MKALTIKAEKNFPIEYAGFLSRYANRSTQKVVNHNVTKFMGFVSGSGYDLESVDQNIVNIYLDSLRQKGISNAAYNQNVSNVRTFLEYCGRKGFEYKTMRVEPYGAVRLASEAGLRNVIGYLEQKKGQSEKKHTKYVRDYLIIYLLFLTGLRKTELISMKHGDIKQEGEKHFYYAKCKGGKDVKKEFPAFLVEEVEKLKQIEGKTSGDYIFTSIYTRKGERLSNKALNLIINAYYQRVNNTKETVTVHSIRALSGFKVSVLTKDIMKAREHLNHANLNTTYIYLSKIQNKAIDYYEDMAQCIRPTAIA